MIQINRINPAPTKLRELGSLQTALDCSAYEEAPEDYISHRKRFPDKRHFSRRDVKDVLMKMHHNKCCYCETKLHTSAYLHVEHFRPKAAVRQSRAENNEFPGYYWLAYCWENLLLACFDCNTTHKGTLFPLEDPAERARSHNDDLRKERERLVDPSEEDPRDHIRFEGDLPVPQTERGRHTIEELGLRRPALTEERLHWFQIIERHIDMVKATSFPEIEALQHEAARFVELAMQPDAEFSSMVIDLVAQREF